MPPKIKRNWFPQICKSNIIGNIGLVFVAKHEYLLVLFRVMKSKYFPDCYFMEARVTKNALYA